MGKPQGPVWNPVSQRWEFKGRSGRVVAYVDEQGLGADIVTVGSQATLQGGSGLRRFLGFTGTSAAFTSVASQQTVLGTITNSTGVAVGDTVFASPKGAAIETANLIVAGFRIPTTNVVNVLISNPGAEGSLAALGWDVTVIKGGS